MGSFTVVLQVSDLARRQTMEIEALVDTEAIYTRFPNDVLARLGVEKEDTRSFELAPLFKGDFSVRR